MTLGTDLLEALPVAVYATDAQGRVTFRNEAAVTLWGERPALGSRIDDGSWHLLWPDGRAMRPEETPLAVVLRDGQAWSGRAVILVREDGARQALAAHAGPLRDGSGKLTGAVMLLADSGDTRQSEIAALHLAAIVASSDDAIVSKTLDGIVTSWNAGAVRIFGYTQEEMIGRSIKRIIPPDLQEEEDEILARLRAGERIDHFDTVRVAKDGRQVHISLTISPIRDSSGSIVGASKVARDVTERKRSEEMRALLFSELNHRVKNTLATIQAIASQSMRSTTSPEAFVAAFNGRVQALARAHDLLVQGGMRGATLGDLVREQVLLGSGDGARIVTSGPRVVLDARVAVQLALVLHELATNARKHGALAVPGGRLSITWEVAVAAGRELHLTWRESGVPGLEVPGRKGFGSTLIERSLEANRGEARVSYAGDGLACAIRLPLAETFDNLADARLSSALSPPPAPRPECPVAAARKGRVLVVEDEPLVALAIEEELRAVGYTVLGPVASAARAIPLIAEPGCEAALVDANLDGQPVDDIVAALTERGVPFAFATGYGREALPRPFRDAPLLTKPFSHSQLLAIVEQLLAGHRATSTGSDLPPARP
ncbi:MAG: MEKHLA domain-containing protein [Geminicoccaceae bacterium]|jgi:PAS domain S-box-containing protein|nr:MEKHLA domain-containing protein [Geminicoccaceae bacterium]